MKIRENLGRDLLASVVVFLVALPLCMGIAIASGVPPALGLVTGIIGGLVVGTLAGSPLQVSGPAAGLAVIVWDLVQTHGLAMLGVIVLLAGLMQLVAGLARLGRVFRAVSPAVIHGMLAGIGVLIFGAQFHVMLDDAPRGDGLTNLITIPSAVWGAIAPMDWSQHQQAAVIGVVTILTIVGWTAWKRPAWLKPVPGPLVGVVVATAAAVAAGLQISTVSVPDDLVQALNIPTADALAHLGNPVIWAAAAALAAVASAESLLCATAVDQMHNGPRTRYDRELAAQGVGNILCGMVGALPMTGVIVRSSANVDAGAKTRTSAILHGAWLLLLVVALPFVLALIPTASLAAVLVYIGFKLVKPATVAQLRRFGRFEVVTYLTTVGVIVAVDLLTGVVAGLALSVGGMIWKAIRLDVEVDATPDGAVLRLSGPATFLAIPRLAAKLETLPPGRHVAVDTRSLSYLDHACTDLIDAWARQYQALGGRVDGWSGGPDEVRAVLAK